MAQQRMMPIARPAAARRPANRTMRRPKRSWLKRAVAFVSIAVLGFYGFIAAGMLLLRWVDPPSTAVQAERRLSAYVEHKPYTKRYQFVPMSDISINLVHAVIAAEDARFYSHHGFDWKEVRAAVDKSLEGGKPRGASTLTQQLVRNLFLSTQPSLVRKAVETSLVPFAEYILGKQRILELYLNVVEWGPGVYGAQAAARYYFHTSASRLTRAQALELASILPAPLHRQPGQTEWYVAAIRTRMRELGW